MRKVILLLFLLPIRLGAQDLDHIRRSGVNTGHAKANINNAIDVVNDITNGVASLDGLAVDGDAHITGDLTANDYQYIYPSSIDMDDYYLGGPISTLRNKDDDISIDLTDSYVNLIDYDLENITLNGTTSKPFYRDYSKQTYNATGASTAIGGKIVSKNYTFNEYQAPSAHMAIEERYLNLHPSAGDTISFKYLKPFTVNVSTVADAANSRVDIGELQILNTSVSLDDNVSADSVIAVKMRIADTGIPEDSLGPIYNIYYDGSDFTSKDDHYSFYSNAGDVYSNGDMHITGDLTVDGSVPAPGISPEYFIAANDATTKEKAVADVVCDGTADDVQINAAMAEGSYIKLSSGTFTVAATISIDEDNVTLEGSGITTIITPVNALNTRQIRIEADHCTIKDLKMDGNSDNQSSYNAKQIWTSGPYTDLRIERVYFYDSYDDALKLQAIDRFWVTDCVFDTPEGMGLYVGNSGIIQNGHITGCHFRYCGIRKINAGIILSGNESDSHIENIEISGCTFVGNEYLDIFVSNNQNDYVTIFNVNINNCISKNSSGFRVEGARNVNVNNNLLRNIDHAGIMVQGLADIVNVSNNSIDSVTNNCIDVIGLTGKIPTNITVSGNTLKHAMESGKAGIKIQDSVDNVVVHGNNIDSCAYGIFCNTGVDFTHISGNKIRNAPQGIRLYNGTTYTMIQNNVFECSGWGVVVGTSADDYTRIIGNDFDASADDVTDGGDGTIYGDNIWYDGTYDNTKP